MRGNIRKGLQVLLQITGAVTLFLGIPIGLNRALAVHEDWKTTVFWASLAAYCLLFALCVAGVAVVRFLRDDPPVGFSVQCANVLRELAQKSLSNIDSRRSDRGTMKSGLSVKYLLLEQIQVRLEVLSGRTLHQLRVQLENLRQGPNAAECLRIADAVGNAASDISRMVAEKDEWLRILKPLLPEGFLEAFRAQEAALQQVGDSLTSLGDTDERSFEKELEAHADKISAAASRVAEVSAQVDESKKLIYICAGECRKLMEFL